MSKGPSATKSSKRLDTAEKTVKRCAIYARVSSSENEGVEISTGPMELRLGSLDL